jgi:hypothetical protein
MSDDFLTRLKEANARRPSVRRRRTTAPPPDWKLVYRISLHEAAHAVVASRARLGPWSFRLKLAYTGYSFIYAGAIETDAPSYADGGWDHEDDICIGSIMMSLAGGIAEGMLGVPSVETARSCGSDDAHVDEDLDLLRHVGDRDELMARLTATTTAIVRDEMPRITALATTALHRMQEAFTDKETVAQVTKTDEPWLCAVYIEFEELRALLSDTAPAVEAGV